MYSRDNVRRVLFLSRKLEIIFCLLFLFFSPGIGWGAVLDPSFRFATLETPHFAIHYHKGLEDLARKTADMAEEVHGLLSPLLQWEPQEKTQLVIADTSDFANGLTTVLPYNLIYLQPVPPGGLSSIGEYDDWLRTLLIHEYAHVLTSDPARGYRAVARRIVGKPAIVADPFSLLMLLATAPPNVFMPHWWHEGLATWSETVLTTKGRGRSSYYAMIYRTAVAEGALPPLDVINGDVPYWPGGNLPYIFGQRFAEYIARHYGEDALGALSKAQAGRIPYAINAPPERLFQGRDYPHLYGMMLEELQTEQEKAISTLRRQPFTETRLLGQAAAGETAPRISPDGMKVAFNRNDRHQHPIVVISDRKGKTIREFRRQLSDGGLSWSADNRLLYYSQAEIHRMSVYQDIYVYDLEKDKVTRLTRGLRAGEPDISPDGRQLVAVITGRGNQNLALLEAAQLPAQDKLVPVMLTTYRSERVASPRWSPDGRQIVYTLTDQEGVTTLRLFTVADRSDRELKRTAQTILNPTWSRAGGQILYTEDETGVFNIYAYDLKEGISRQITHLLTGGFQPDLAPDGKNIVFALYRSDGFTIASLATSSADWREERSPAIATALYPARAHLPSTPAKGTGEEPQARDYNPLPTLRPHFWLPSLRSYGSGTTMAGALTAGRDALGFHAYQAEVLYGPTHHEVYYDVAYHYDRWFPKLTLQGYGLPAVYGNLLRSGDYLELNRGLIAKLPLPFPKLESRFALDFGYHIQKQEALSEVPAPGVNVLPPFQGRRDNLFVGFTYNNSLKYPWSVSQEEGRNIAFLFRDYEKSWGSDLDSREYTASWEEYIALSAQRLPHHVLLARLSGGISDGERILQQAFQLGGLYSFLNPFALRGYPERLEGGKYAATGTLEYRFPGWYPLRGKGTFPVFYDRLHGAAFLDAGQVWGNSQSFRGDRLKVGAGLEARFDMTLGYWLKLTPAIGFAHGFDEGGESLVYITIYAKL